eukprot:6193068-Pleurochrysis_carterae.AAC.1
MPQAGCDDCRSRFHGAQDIGGGATGSAVLIEIRSDTRLQSALYTYTNIVLHVAMFCTSTVSDSRPSEI